MGGGVGGSVTHKDRTTNKRVVTNRGSGRDRAAVLERSGEGEDEECQQIFSSTEVRVREWE